MLTSELATYAEAERALLGPLLRLLRGRNTLLDALFYDIGALSLAERALLLADTAPEGSVLLVHPAGAAAGIERFRTVSGFLLRAAGRCEAVALPGVGSSALGAAALARNLADLTGGPVAAVVAGNGLADLVGEALGGWFAFGSANRLRQQMDRLLDRSAPLLSALDETPGRGAAPTTLPGYVEGAPDSEALLGMLSAAEFNPRLLLGHSKGSLSIANALFGLAESQPARFSALAPRLSVATLGAVVHLPDALGRVGQFLGEVDWLGGMNSRRQVRHEVIPGAWHHLNARLPGAMTLRDALGAFLAAPPPTPLLALAQEEVVLEMEPA